MEEQSKKDTIKKEIVKELGNVCYYKYYSKKSIDVLINKYMKQAETKKNKNIIKKYVLKKIYKDPNFKKQKSKAEKRIYEDLSRTKGQYTEEELRRIIEEDDAAQAEEEIKRKEAERKRKEEERKREEELDRKDKEKERMEREAYRRREKHLVTQDNLIKFIKKLKHLNSKKDYYKILGIPKNSTPKDIKKAWRKNLRRYHPDKNIQYSNLYDEISKYINGAYGKLKIIKKFKGGAIRSRYKKKKRGKRKSKRIS